jgi:hypothetical protein
MAAPGMGRGYGRDFGGGGRNQGFDGSWGQGYGASFDQGDGRDGPGGVAEASNWSSEGHAGDEGPFGGRGPQGWRRSDARLHEHVCEHLTEDRLLDARGIEVEAAGGVVTLRGEVPGPADTTLAEMIARQVRGVTEVRNELTVRRPARPDDRPPLGAATSAEFSSLREGERDETGRQEGPRHFPKLST